MGGHVFISYVREDAEAVGRLVHYLRAFDVPVWLDTSDIAPGQRWLPTLRRAVSEGALAFVACFSEHSRTREKTVQRVELDWASKEVRLRSRETTWLIPVRLGDCDLPSVNIGNDETIEDLEWIDLFGDDDRWEEGARRLVRSIHAILDEHGAAPRTPASRPDTPWLDVPEQAIVQGTIAAAPWPDGLPRMRRHTLSGGAPGSVRPVPVPGRMLLATTGNGFVRLWDPVTGHPYRELSIDFGVVHASCLVPHGGRVLLATGDGHHGIQLWDPEAGRRHGEPMEGHTDNVLSLCALGVPGPALLASGSNMMDGTVRLWDVATGSQVGEPLGGMKGGTVRASCAVPVGDRVLLATGGHDGLVRLWDPATAGPYGNPLGDLEPGVGVYDACVVPVDGRSLLATANGDGTVRLWDPIAGIAYGMPLRGHAGIVLAVCALPVGDRVLLASAGHGGVIRLWDPAALAAVGEPLMGHGGWVNRLCAFRVGDEMLLASISNDGTAGVWGPDDGTARRGRATDGGVRPLRHPLDEVLRGSTRRIPWPDELPQQEWAGMTTGDGEPRRLCAVQGGDRMLVATVGTRKDVQLWDPAAARPYGEPLTGHTGGVGGLCAVRVGGRMLLATGDRIAEREGTIRLWDPRTATPVGHPIVTGPVLRMCAVSHSPTQDLLATADAEGAVWLWNPTTAEPHGSPHRNHGTRVTAMCAVPVRGRMLLAIADLGGITLWDPATGKAAAVLLRRRPLRRAQPARVLAMCVVPVGSRMLLATGGTDGAVLLWDPTSRKEARGPSMGHRRQVRAVCALPQGDGALVASAGEDGELRLWDPESCVAVGEPLTGHDDTVTDLCAVLVEDRVFLASVGYDSTVRLWGPRR